MRPEIIFTADYGVAKAAELLQCEKSAIYKVLRDKLERDPKDSWQKAARKHLRAQGYSFGKQKIAARLDPEEPIFEDI